MSKDNPMMNFNYDRMLQENRMKKYEEFNEKLNAKGLSEDDRIELLKELKKINDKYSFDSNGDRKQSFEELSKKYDGEKWYISNAEYLTKAVEKSIAKINGKYSDYCSKMEGTLCDVVDSNGNESESNVLVIYGGNNGTGKWRNYIDEISDLIHELERKVSRVWICELKNDCADDLFTLVLGIEY